MRLLALVVLLLWGFLLDEAASAREQGEKRVKDEFISGHAYMRHANWTFCNRQPIRFEPEQIKDYDVVFINTDMFDEAMLQLRKNRMDLNATHAGKFVAIFGNSDVTFSQDKYELVVSYAVAVYAVNSACSKVDCPLLKPIPIGFVDYPDMSYSHLFMKVISTEEYGKKRNMLYMNYRHDTNPEERLACTNTFLKSPVPVTAWSAKQLFRKDDFPQYVAYEHGLDRTDFFSALIRSKYVLVPRGNGLDTHRVYEAIYFNAIPVVLSGQLDHFYRTLPVLIVQSWAELTEEFLRLHYVKNRLRLTNWKRTNSHWKRVDHWMPDLKKYKRMRKKLQIRRVTSGPVGKGGDDDDVSAMKT